MGGGELQTVSARALRWRETCMAREERTRLPSENLVRKEALAVPMDGRLAPHFHFGVHLGR